MLNDYVISLIRTAVPAGVGAALAYLASRLGVVLDEESSAALVLGVGALAVSAYYAVVRLLEARWPFFGRLLGAAQPPAYARPALVRRQGE